MIVKLLTEHHLEFLSLKGGCRGLSESKYVKMPHSWKSHATAHIVLLTFCMLWVILHVFVLSLAKCVSSSLCVRTPS